MKVLMIQETGIFEEQEDLVKALWHRVMPQTRIYFCSQDNIARAYGPIRGGVATILSSQLDVKTTSQ